MTTFRNVAVDPAVPVEQWPAEAIETVLDRGSLADWRRMARAIRADPWGPVARTVASIAGWDEHYGVDRLMTSVIARARSDVDARARARYAERIRRARASTGLSLHDLARLAGTSASRLSDYENGKVAPTTDVLGRIELVTEGIVAQGIGECSTRAGGRCPRVGQEVPWQDRLRSSLRVVGYEHQFVAAGTPPPRSSGRTVSTVMSVGIADLRESLGGYAAGFDADLLSAAQAEHVMEQASRIEKIAATLKALAAGRLAATGCWRAEGDRSPAHLLARRTGTTVVEAAAAIDTARRLQDLPETSAAARRGELSAEQASAIADAAGSDPGAERGLLETARRSPLSELREQCARTKAAAVADSEGRRRRIHQRRSLRSYTDPDGEWHLHCRNNPEVGARIMAALDPLREAIFRQARADARREPPDAYAADALAEMARRSTTSVVEVVAAAPRTAMAAIGQPSAASASAGTVEGADAVGRGEAVTSGQAVASGAESARTFVSPGAPAARGRPTGTPKIIVRVDLEALLRGRPVEGEVCEIAGFGPVAVSAVRDMIDTDDPFLTAVATRGVRLVGVAHLGRRPNALQQTALQWLYPSCANEACSAQARLDYEHRVDWASTHMTVLDLLDRLCPHCHALKTRQNWSLIEGRGKRSFVPPGDPRHPRRGVAPRVNSPPRK